MAISKTVNRKMDLSCIGSYRKYKTFDSVEELNIAVRGYVDELKSMPIRSDLKEGLIKLLKTIKRYSCKYFGVSFRTYNNLGEMLNVDRKTIERRMERLEKLGFIQIVNAKNIKTMYQTSNIIRILKPLSENEMSLFGMIPNEEAKEENEMDEILAAAAPYDFEVSNESLASLFDEMPMEEKMSDKIEEKCPTIKTSSSLKQNNIINIKERITKSPSKLLNFVPKVFKETAAVLNTADRNIYELWNVVKQVNKKYNLDKETIRTLALEGFNILKGLLKDSYKEGKEQIKNMFGKFNRIMHNVISNYLAADQEEDQEENNAPKELPFYNWLVGENEKTEEISLTEKIDSYVPYIPHNEGDIDCEMPY